MNDFPALRVGHLGQNPILLPPLPPEDHAGCGTGSRQGLAVGIGVGEGIAAKVNLRQALKRPVLLKHPILQGGGNQRHSDLTRFVCDIGDQHIAETVLADGFHGLLSPPVF